MSYKHILLIGAAVFVMITIGWSFVGITPAQSEAKRAAGTQDQVLHPILYGTTWADILDVQRTKLEQDPALEKRVSVIFERASFDDVLRWLGTQGLNFAAQPDSPRPTARITLQVTDLMLRDVLDAISEVFGGTWDKKGDVYLFKVAAPRFELRGGTPSEQRPDSQPPGEMLDRLREWAEKFHQGWEGKDLPDLFKALPKDDFLRDLQERFKGGEWKEIPGGKMFVLPPGGDFKSINPEEFFKMNPEVKEKLESLRSHDFATRLEMRELFDSLPRIGVGGANISKLMETITADQWATHDAKGHLTYDDLTEEQREMVGFGSGAKVEITVSMNGKTLKIRST